MPTDIGLARAGHRIDAEQSDEHRYERMGFPFHERLRNGFLAIAARDPGRCKVIDATVSEAAVSAAVLSAIELAFDVSLRP